jgi:hypothetical protein
MIAAAGVHALVHGCAASDLRIGADSSMPLDRLVV